MTPPWMVRAWNELGVCEERGGENPRIMEYHRTVDPGAVWLDEDEDAWCASFLGWCLHREGLDYTESARARSYLDYGVPLVSPRPGCIVVLERPPNPAHGHVGFWLGESDAWVSLLSGNTGDRVCSRDFPASRVLAYRWPTVAGIPWEDS